MGDSIMSKRMLFVYNPKAGKGKITASLSDILDIFCRSEYEILVHATQYPRDAYEKVKKYIHEVDLVVCCGGDGTLDEVVTAVMELESEIPVGYIPAGSTNDFANSLFMPKNMLTVANMIMQEKSYRCDVGKFNNHTFAYVAAFGLFTDVSYATNQDLKNIFGHAAYVLEGAKRLFDIKHYYMKIESEELMTEGDFILGMITNSRSVGGFKHLTGKNIDMNDGLFEVTLIKQPKNPIELNEIITALLTQEDHTDMIYSFKTKKIKITSWDDVSWTLDGEFGGQDKEVLIENKYQALNLYLVSTKEEEI